MQTINQRLNEGIVNLYVKKKNMFTHHMKKRAAYKGHFDIKIYFGNS